MQNKSFSRCDMILPSNLCRVRILCQIGCIVVHTTHTDRLHCASASINAIFLSSLVRRGYCVAQRCVAIRAHFTEAIARRSNMCATRFAYNFRPANHSPGPPTRRNALSARTSSFESRRTQIQITISIPLIIIKLSPITICVRLRSAFDRNN